MVTAGLLVRFEAKPGKEAPWRKLVLSGLPMVRDVPATTAWFGIGLGDNQYGILRHVPRQRCRFAHLSGKVPRALARNALSLLAVFPT